MESFDNTPSWSQYEGSSRWLRLVGAAAGAVILAVGILILTILPFGGAHPTFGQKVGPASVAVVVGGFLTFALLRKPAEISGVEVSDTTVKFRYSNGRTIEGRWDDPALRARVSHGIRTPPSDPKRQVGWVLAWRSGGARIGMKVVTLAVGDALVRRARRLGLQTETVSRVFAQGGATTHFESIGIRGRLGR